MHFELHVLLRGDHHIRVSTTESCDLEMRSVLTYKKSCIGIGV